MVIATDIGGLALCGQELAGDLFLVGSELFSDRSKGSLQLRILILRRQSLSPVKSEVEVASAVVDAADLPRRRLVVDEEFSGGLVEGISQDLGLRVAKGVAEVLEGDREREKLSE